MKKRAFALLLLPCLLPLKSCSSTIPYAHAFAYDLKDTFIASFFIELKLDLEDSFTYAMHDAERSQAKQNKQINASFEKESTGALIVNTVDRLASGAIIRKRKASATNGPLIFVNREPLRDDLDVDDPFIRDNCFYVGANSQADGLLQSDIADKTLGGPESFPMSSFDKNKDGILQIAILKGELGHQDAELRTKYCVEGMKQKGYQVEILDSIYANWERETAKQAMGEFELDKIELLFTNNDDMALGAIDHLHEIGAPASEADIPFNQAFFPIVGVDGTAAGKKAIRFGYLSGTVLNDAASQARLVTQIITSHLSGTPLPESHDNIERKENFYYVKGVAIDKNNIDSL